MNKIVPDGAILESVFSGGVFTEGPASDRKGNILFSDCIENLIYSFNETTHKTAVWDGNSRHANGMNFDSEGRLVVCCDGKKYPSSELGGAHAVRRYEKDGSIRVLATTYNGKKLNGPNDLCFDSHGQIYFTDPRYGNKDDIEQDCMAVYRISINGELTRVIDNLESPNGILITADDKTMYIVDHNMDEGGARTLVKYISNLDGTWERTETLLDFGTGYGMDGMVLDTAGNIYVTGGVGELAGVYIVSPEGKSLGFIQTPETPGNCTFGGEELDTLYIAATSSLYRIQLNTRGFSAWM
jgi:sugar lactone lactonase YvrE